MLCKLWWNVVVDWMCIRPPLVACRLHCTHVAMESSGVYWKPIYAILEGAFEIVVANAQHVKKVPGRKTDVKDAEWIADLLVCCGPVSFSRGQLSGVAGLAHLTRTGRAGGGASR